METTQTAAAAGAAQGAANQRYRRQDQQHREQRPPLHADAARFHFAYARPPQVQRHQIQVLQRLASLARLRMHGGDRAADDCQP